MAAQRSQHLGDERYTGIGKDGWATNRDASARPTHTLDGMFRRVSQNRKPVPGKTRNPLGQADNHHTQCCYGCRGLLLPNHVFLLFLFLNEGVEIATANRIDSFLNQ